MYESIGYGYLTLAAFVFTAEWVIAAVAGMIWLQRLAKRGHEEEGRDLVMSAASREDIVKAEIGSRRR